VLSIVLLRMVHVAAQWERGIVLRLGKFQSVRGPGVIVIFPVIDHLKKVDTRIQTVAIPQQSVITRDNVPLSINGVLFFKVVDVTTAIVSIQDFEFSILQYAQVTLRDVIGRLAFDEMLAELEEIQKQIEALVGEVARGWGLEVDGLRLQDIDMPADLKKMMARQASAEREKRATITKAEGDKLAALNLADAAATMLKSPGAMQLRTLQTIDGLGPQPSNTVVLAVPSDLFTMTAQFTELLNARVRAASS
jgi:regulator of protease activity HflC (stomatin/prohibitin superfamily)